MKLICTRCDGLGEIRHKARDMTPLQNVAIYDRMVLEDGKVWSMHARHIVIDSPIDYYCGPCKCEDGYVSWRRGSSLPPAIPLSRTAKQAASR